MWHYLGHTNWRIVWIMEGYWTYMKRNRLDHGGILDCHGWILDFYGKDWVIWKWHGMNNCTVLSNGLCWTILAPLSVWACRCGWSQGIYKRQTEMAAHFFCLLLSRVKCCLCWCPKGVIVLWGGDYLNAFRLFVWSRSFCLVKWFCLFKRPDLYNEMNKLRSNEYDMLFIYLFIYLKICVHLFINIFIYKFIYL